MLVVNNLHHSFGNRSVLRGVDFSIEPQSIVGLIGPSGGGKSTLLKLICQIDACTCGRVTLNGECDFPVSLMFQEGALFDSLSVIDNVAFSLVHGKVPHTLLPKKLRAEVQERCIEVLSRVGLARAINKMPAQLSGGMRRRVSLARAIVAKPSLLLLDDPTSGLDPVASSVIMELIRDLHKDYRPTVLMVSHDLRRLFPSVERVLALFDGKIVFDGAVEDIRGSNLPLLKRFVSARYDLDDEGEDNDHQGPAQV